MFDRVPNTPLLVGILQYLIRITETTKTNTKLAVFKYKQISAHSGILSFIHDGKIENISRPR